MQRGNHLGYIRVGLMWSKTRERYTIHFKWMKKNMHAHAEVNMYWPCGVPEMQTLRYHPASCGLPDRWVVKVHGGRADGNGGELTIYYDGAGRVVAVNGVTRNEDGAVVDTIDHEAFVLLSHHDMQ